MSKRRRHKGAKLDRDDQLFAEMEQVVERTKVLVAEAVDALPAVVQEAIADAVRPYQAHLAQQEKDALAAGHPGWGVADLHHFPARLT